MEDKNTFTPSKKHSDILRNSGAILVIRILNDAIRFFATISLAHYISDIGFAHLNYILIFIEPFKIAANFGMDFPATRLMTTNTHMEASYLHKFLFLKRITSLTSYGVLIFAMFSFTNNEYWFGIMIIGLTIPLVAQSASWNLIVQNRHKMHLFIPFQTLEGIVYVSFIFIGIYFNVHIQYFYFTYIFTDVAFYFICRYVVGKKLKFKPTKDFNITSKQILKIAYPLAIADIFIVTYNRLSMFILEKYFTDVSEKAINQFVQTPMGQYVVGIVNKYFYINEEQHLMEAIRCLMQITGKKLLGQYLMAVRSSEFVLFFAGALGMSLMPTLSNLSEKNPIEAKNIFLRYYLLSIVIVFPLMIFLGQFSYIYFEIIRAEFLGSVAPFKILAIASAIMFQNVLSAFMINAFGKYVYILRLTMINLPVNIVCCLLLIPEHKGMGAAYSILITEGINMLMQMTIIYRIFAKMKNKQPLAN